MNMIERIGLAIVKASVDVRYIYGLYDYSKYPGDAPPHQVKDHLNQKTILLTNNEEEALKKYQEVCRNYIARAAIEAMRKPTEEILNVKHMSIGYTADEVWKMFIDALLKE